MHVITVWTFPARLGFLCAAAKVTDEDNDIVNAIDELGREMGSYGTHHSSLV
jgi:hypothetical protein